MFLISNRNIVESNFQNGVGNEEAFGEGLNSKGPNEIRLAHADKSMGKWQVTLVEEPTQLTPDNLPSIREFSKLRKKLMIDKKNCIFFVHGFNQSFEESLEKALSIEKRYNVEVVVFSWPSNPGGFIRKEYRHAKRTAKCSVGALDATLEKLGSYLREPFNQDDLLNCDVKFSFMTYSLGNFLFQNYVRDVSYEAETSIFENIILCQADVDNQGHEVWVDQIETGKRIYVTINENDYVLKWSDANFQKARLGRQVQGLNSRKAKYIDFTDGPNVGKKHGVFLQETNNIIKQFFTEVFNGRRGEIVDGLKYDSPSNTYKFL